MLYEVNIQKRRQRNVLVLYTLFSILHSSSNHPFSFFSFTIGTNNYDYNNNVRTLML